MVEFNSTVLLYQELDTYCIPLLLSRCYIPLGPWRPNSSKFYRSLVRGVRDIIGDTSGCPQDNPQTPLGRSPVTRQRHVPVVYSLQDPRGLTSSRIRLSLSLSHQSILFHNRVLIAPYLQSPPYTGRLRFIGASPTPCLR